VIVWALLIWEAMKAPTMPDDYGIDNDKYDDWHPDQDIK